MTMTPFGPPLMLGVKGAAAYLGVGRARMYGWLEQGVIPSVRIGRRILVPRVALERFAERIAAGKEP